METINGEWYMKGCGREDPSRLRSPGEAAELIRRVGLLPLFSNDVPGFSLEERTWAGDWWTDDPARDPWAWRQQLAAEPDILYGKFFDRRAGFVSAQWFPAFANFRRKGYDFDTLIDEGLAPHRARKLMEPFLTDGMPNDTVLHSFVLRDRTGFGKGGEKNFEGVLTDLEMESFLIIGGFRQRLNKQGRPYGWHIAVIQTPEAKLGYEAVTAAYSESPQRSYERLMGQLRQYFPNAEEAQFSRWVGKRG